MCIFSQPWASPGAPAAERDVMKLPSREILCRVSVLACAFFVLVDETGNQCTKTAFWCIDFASRVSVLACAFFLFL